jgi:hypothetical protein
MRSIKEVRDVAERMGFNRIWSALQRRGRVVGQMILKESGREPFL